MTKTEQMRRVLWSVRAILLLAVVLLVLLITIAKGADTQPAKLTGDLSDTAMWILGGIGTCFAAFAIILLRHENIIAKMQGDPEPVPNTLCIANMKLVTSELSHGTERFEKIEDVVAGVVERENNSKARHEEMMSLLRELKN